MADIDTMEAADDEDLSRGGKEVTSVEQTFKEAFADALKARKAGGAKTFTWKGKEYTTELASDKKAAPAKAAPAVDAKETARVARVTDALRGAPADRVKKSTFPKSESKFLGMKSGGSVSSASRRADGIAQRGKTKGRMV